MAVIGYLSDFSIPEIFRLLGQGHKTGILTVFNHHSRHAIWFYEGRVVAYSQDASSRFLSLSDRLSQLCNLGRYALDRMQRLRPDSRPLGHWLQEQGLIQESQLQQLFREQVVQPMADLFAMGEGQFRFRPQSGLPLVEMTGLSIPAAALIMAGFRHLEDWSSWEGDLPSAQMLLTSVGGTPPMRPSMRLSPLELKIWQQADSHQSLEAIARHLEQSLVEVQKVAFRLQRAGLLECLDSSELSSEVLSGQNRPNNWMDLPQLVSAPLRQGIKGLLQ